MQPWWAYIVAGAAGGILSGTFGVGGGIILVPALVLAFDLPQKSAQGICLAAMVPMVLTGALRYWANKAIAVDLRLAALVAVGGVAGALVGSTIAAHISGSHLRKLFAVLMMVVSMRMLLK